MSNPFNFDPFAAPAPAASASANAGSGNGSGANNAAAAPPSAPTPLVASIKNPFDNFGFVQPNSGNSNNNAAGGENWQQTARAAISSGNAAWKNVAGSMASSTSSSQQPRRASQQQNLARSNSQHSSSSTLQPPHSAKRIIPYTSPISTLETNWDPWLYSAQSSSPQSLWGNGGNFTTYLAIRANEGCCLNGGVESLLRWSKSRVGKGSGAGTELLEKQFDSSLSLGENTEDTASMYGSVSESGHSNRGLGKTPSGGGGGLRFLKSGLKKAQQSIERSVTTMAIKADGGKNPDQLCVSLHYCGGMNGGNGSPVNVSINNALGDAIGTNPEVTMVGGMVGDVCLSRTEWVELPSSGRAASDDEGVLFSIPLCVPDLSFLEAAAGKGSGVQLTVRLYIRSGAALLKAVANREYCIGESALLYSNLMQLIGSGQIQQQQQQQQSGPKCGAINLPFTTGMLAETSSFSNSASFNSSNSSGISGGGGDPPAALHITATPRIKFNPVCTYGWSLTDPTTLPPAGSLSWLHMFNPPLDQGYVFRGANNQQITQQQQQPNMQASSSSNNLLLANERAVESALVLPLATTASRLFSQAARQSQLLATNAATKMRKKEAVYLRGDDQPRNKAIVDAALADGAAFAEVGIVALVMLGDSPQIQCGLGGAFDPSVPSVKANVSFQPPHSIFEESLAAGSCPLLDEASGAGYINNSAGLGGAKEALSARFCPRILTGTDDLLPGIAGTKPNDKYVGSVRVEVAVGYANSIVDNISCGISGGTSVEGTIELENYLNIAQQQGGGKAPALVPAIDANTGSRIGTFVLLIRVMSSNANATNPNVNGNTPCPASSGLVSVAGLDTLTEDIGISPYMDYDPPTSNSQPATPPTPRGVRKRQVATMGSFVTPRFLAHQSSVVRENDAKVLEERLEKYNQSLQSGLSADVKVEDESGLELFKRRAPKSFRPSNSRGDPLLAGIGFNVHVQSLSLNTLNDDANAIAPVGVTKSVTHGAPADHARGFGGSADDGSKKPDDLDPRGGLRRLESKRLEFAKELDDSINGLVSAVGEHFKSRSLTSAARQQAGVKPSRHIPPDLPAIVHYRSKAIEWTQRLHSLTWDVAVRRANCFSQALGIAVTSYVASLSDGGPAWRSGQANVWARHGYLITFEGLLSAVGKELGMIEDASAAISQLRMVSVVLVPDNSASNPTTAQQNSGVPVSHSPYVRWVNLTDQPNIGSHSKTQYRLEIGLDPAYYQSRVPDPLKNGASVRFFPILFQMGVDIRQWGVNAGRNVTSQMKAEKALKGSGVGGSNADLADLDNIDVDTRDGLGGSILDDGDEEDEGNDVADNEILLALNVEGFRKLNAYAHSVNPTAAGVLPASSAPPVFDLLEQTQAQQLPVHPSLVLLSEAIRASAGKMEHSVLDRAAMACQRFGGGSTVFCKSGKDRTAMQVTFKQAQFVHHFTGNITDGSGNSQPMTSDSIALLVMRKHGNRIPICEKNAGEPKFAFNPLQRKFMPEMLRPEASLCTWSKPET